MGIRSRLAAEALVLSVRAARIPDVPTRLRSGRAGSCYGAAYADIGELAQLAAGDHVAGNVARVVWLLPWLLPPVPTSRNWTVPLPLGVNTAIQYFVPVVTVIAATVREFHAPAAGLARVAWPRSVPGLLLDVFEYRPTVTFVAVEPAST